MASIPDVPAHTRYLNRAIPAFAAASPALGALHAIRARRSSPHIELSPLHCARCGSLALSRRLERKSRATSRSSRVRKTNKGKDKRLPPQQHPPPPSHCSYIRITRITCAACGHTDTEAIAADDQRAHPELKADYPISVSARTITDSSSVAAQDPSVVEEPISSQRSPDNITEIIGQSNLVEIKTPEQSTSSMFPAVVSVDRPRDSKISSSSVSSASKRTKKRSGLQEMLARSKEQKRDKEENVPGNGLAAFLSGL